VVRCTHLGEISDVAPTPGSQACTDCLAIGEHVWVHLRQCLSCGHVACCDSSPHRHASAHHEASGHPLMRSIQPGEDWRWCFVDHMLV